MRAGCGGSWAFTMAEAANKILTKMLERLFAAIANGPSINCRPHSSRQRIDLTQFTKMQDIGPGEALAGLLGESRAVRVMARVPAPKRQETAVREDGEDAVERELTPQ